MMYGKGKFRSACCNFEKSRPQNTNTCIKTGWASDPLWTRPTHRAWPTHRAYRTWGSSFGGTEAKGDQGRLPRALCRIRLEETQRDALCSVRGGACALLRYTQQTTTYGGPPATVPGPPLPPRVTCPAHATQPDPNWHSAQAQELMKRQKEGGRTQMLDGRQCRGVEARRSR